MTTDQKSEENLEQITELNQKLRQRKRESKIGLIIIILTALLLAYWIRAGFERGVMLRQPQTTYQAVFLSNGQVYFGSIIDQNQEEITLSDIYYFDSLRSLQYNNLSDTSKLEELPGMVGGC